MSVGDNIKKYRKLNKLTQKELAEKISKNERTIRGYEAGVIVPPFAVIKQIANTLNINYTELMDQEEIKQLIANLISDANKISATIIGNNVPDWAKTDFKNIFKTPLEFWEDVTAHYPDNFCNLEELFSGEDLSIAVNEIAEFLELAFELKVKEIVNRNKK